MVKIPFPSLLSAVIALASAPAWAGEVPVADVPGLVGAIQAAKPGDTIVLAPGTYEVHQSKIACEAAGTAEAPIVVRAAELGSVTIRFDAVEGFHVRGPHWEFANLDIEGICAADSDCEHAFHVTGAAENTWLHHNRMHGFNAMIKGNGEPIGPGDSFVWPDDVVIEYNELYNPAPRDTGNPVTPIDVVGGQRWVLRGNFIHDHAKGGGDGVSYAAFLKGHSKDGLIERNLVVCELLHSGQVRLGLSLGGGGTGPDSICEDGACKPEHERGILRNNLIVNCPADVGVYVNAGADSKIVNNTLYNTAGIDMRFAETTGLVANNLMNGKIRDRDGGTSMKMNNLAELQVLVPKALERVRERHADGVTGGGGRGRESRGGSLGLGERRPRGERGSEGESEGEGGASETGHARRPPPPVLAACRCSDRTYAYAYADADAAPPASASVTSTTIISARSA